MQSNSINLLIIALIAITIIGLGIYGINKAAKVASEAVDKVAGSPGLTSTLGEIGKMVKEINDDKVLADIGNFGTVMKGINEKDILSGVDASLDNVNTVVADVRNTQLIPTAEGALQDARTLMEGVDDASMRQLNQIVQNCGDGITMEIPKGKLAEFKIDNPIGDDVNVQVPSSDMNLKLKFPGCSENFKKEAFSKIIKDTFKTKNLPSRFEREFHIDANGHIRTGVKDKRV